MKIFPGLISAIQSHIYLLILFFSWVLAILLVNPLGEFPLNDDWAYARSVHTLFETGDFKISPWAAPNLIINILWGYLFCLPTGFSFTMLRLSSIVAGGIGIMFTFLLFHKIFNCKKKAFLGTLIIAFNPIYFLLSNTYMTDVLFYTLTVISVYFYFSFFSEQKNQHYLLALLFTIIAVLSRQIAIIIPVVFAISWLIINRFHVRQIFPAIFPILLAVCIQFFYDGYLRSSGNLNIHHTAHLNMLLNLPEILDTERVYRTFYYFLISCISLGLFVLPLTALLFIKGVQSKIISKKWIRRQMIFFIPLVFIILFENIFTEYNFPFAGNNIYNLGLGPALLKGAHFKEAFSVNDFYCFILTVLGTFSFYMLFVTIIHARSSILDKIKEGNHFGIAALFAILLLAIYLLPLSFINIFDRYLLIPLFMFIILIFSLVAILKINQKWTARSFLAGVLILIPVIFFSVAGTHDYLSWNRTRWQALNYLTRSLNIPPEKIDGGFEFNGWHLYGNGSSLIPEEKESWWWVEDDQYIVAMNRMEGYEVLKEYIAKGWLVGRDYKIYLLEEQGNKTAFAASPACEDQALIEEGY